MKILFALHCYRPSGRAGGSATWFDAMAGAFERMGHQCSIIDHQSPECGAADLCLVSHTSMMPRVGHLDCPKIYTSHGVLPALEKPAPGANCYVSVSEEVQRNLSRSGYESVIIRNPIDTRRYQTEQATSPELRRVFYCSRYQWNGAAKIVTDACDLAGVELETAGVGTHLEDTAGAMCQADLVIGLGRTALEAMSCGRNVVVYGYSGGDGIATPETMRLFRECNCSGRYFAQEWTHRQLAAELMKYNPAHGARLRQYILDNNDADKIARQYLGLILGAI